MSYEFQIFFQKIKLTLDTDTAVSGRDRRYYTAVSGRDRVDRVQVVQQTGKYLIRSNDYHTPGWSLHTVDDNF
jgi:hypothetical protein